MFYNDLSLFDQKVKMILWSIHTFWYKGSAENKGNKLGKMFFFLKNNSPDLKAYFSKNRKNEIDISQMHCKCYTRYESNTDEQIGQIYGESPKNQGLAQNLFLSRIQNWQNWARYT